MAKQPIDDLLKDALASTQTEVDRLTKEIDNCDKTRAGCYQIGITEASKSITDALKQRRNDARDELDKTLRNLTDLRFHTAVEHLDASGISTPAKQVFYAHELKFEELVMALMSDTQLEKFALETAGRLGCTTNRPSVPELDKTYHAALEHRKTLVLERKKAQAALDGLRSAIHQLEPVVIPEFGEKFGQFVNLQPGQKMPPGDRLPNGQTDGPAVTVDYLADQIDMSTY